MTLTTRPDIAAHAATREESLLEQAFSRATGTPLIMGSPLAPCDSGTRQAQC